VHAKSDFCHVLKPPSGGLGATQKHLVDLNPKLPKSKIRHPKSS
jgi:hypothetical protein